LIRAVPSDYEGQAGGRQRLTIIDDLREHVLNAVGTETPSGVRMLKGKSSKNIDVAISLAMACVAAVQVPALHTKSLVLCGERRTASGPFGDFDIGRNRRIGEPLWSLSRRWTQCAFFVDQTSTFSADLMITRRPVVGNAEVKTAWPVGTSTAEMPDIATRMRSIFHRCPSFRWQLP